MESATLFWLVTACSFLIAFIPSIVNAFLRLRYRRSEEDRKLQQQIVDLKSEQQKFNIVDEFAKYSKIQRQITKLVEELKKENSSRATSRLKLKFGISTLLYIISSAIVMFLMWKYGREPIVEIQAEWVYPLDRIIISKSADTVGISVTFWLLVSSTVAKIVHRSVSNIQF